MANVSRHFPIYLLISTMIFASVPCTLQLQSSQAWSLLRIQHLLNYPTVLSNWTTYSDFCNAEPSSNLSIVCYEDNITQLHISGNADAPLSRSFSIESFIKTLTRLPNLKVLHLTSLGLWGPFPAKIVRLSNLEIVNMSSNYLYGEIPSKVSRMKNLQTLVLDHNIITGQVPDSLSELPLLAVLSLRNNSLSGHLPDSLSGLVSLRMLVLSSNSLSGGMPDLSSLTNLQVLDVESNYLGPEFPSLGRKIISVNLKKNKFTGGLPQKVTSYYLLERLDLSLNRFVGPFLPSLLSLPSIRYLSITGNRFTGMLFKNMSCNIKLEYVDLSSNLLTGDLPTCLVSISHNSVVLCSANCLRQNDSSQHPTYFCKNQALAVGILPLEEKKAPSKSKAGVVAGVVVGIILSTLLVGIVAFFAIRQTTMKRASKKPTRIITEHVSSGYPSRLLTDARYISQTMKLGALGIPAYRSFSLEEIEAATNNFEASNLMGEGSYGQMFRGQLKDGSLVAIRSLKLKKSQNSQNFNRQIELISKLRHHHLVSALGHCFEYNLDDPSISRLFLVFEFLSNGTLRSHISEGIVAQQLTWMQRISAVVGVVKGIQFLHGGILPGLYENNLKITNVFLDQNLVAKIGSYNLPILENVRTKVDKSNSSSGSKQTSERGKYSDKIDIYEFGIILLEVVSGEPIESESQVDRLKEQFQESIFADDAARRSVVDPFVSQSCCDDSLRTIIEICLRCLLKEPAQRPSVEDVLWNLKFAAQVQESWLENSSSNAESGPLSDSQIPHSPLSLD